MSHITDEIDSYEKLDIFINENPEYLTSDDIMFIKERILSIQLLNSPFTKIVNGVAGKLMSESRKKRLEKINKLKNIS